MVTRLEETLDVNALTDELLDLAELLIGELLIAELLIAELLIKELDAGARDELTFDELLINELAVDAFTEDKIWLDTARDELEPRSEDVTMIAILETATAKELLALAAAELVRLALELKTACELIAITLLDVAAELVVIGLVVTELVTVALFVELAVSLSLPPPPPQAVNQTADVNKMQNFKHCPLVKICLRLKNTICW